MFCEMYGNSETFVKCSQNEEATPKCFLLTILPLSKLARCEEVLTRCRSDSLLYRLCPRSGCFPPNVRRVGICKIWSVDNIQWRSWPLGVLSFQSTPCMGGKKVLEIKMLSSSMWQAWSVSKGWWGLKWQLLCVVGKWGTLALKPNPRRTIHRQKDDAEQ